MKMRWSFQLCLAVLLLGVADGVPAGGGNDENVRAELWFGGYPGADFPTLYYLDQGEVLELKPIPSRAIGPIGYGGRGVLELYENPDVFDLPSEKRPPPAVEVSLSGVKHFILLAPSGRAGQLAAFTTLLDETEFRENQVMLFNLTATPLAGLVNGERVAIEVGSGSVFGPIEDARRGVPVVVLQLAKYSDENWERAYENKIMMRGGRRFLMFLYRTDNDKIRSVAFTL